MPKLDLDAEQVKNDERRELKDAATEGKWDTGPLTGAGSVWVYAKGDPLGEPTGPWNWAVRRFRKVLALYRIRRRETYEYGMSPDAKKQKWWRGQQANATFIVAARNDDVEDSVDALIAECREWRALFEKEQQPLRTAVSDWPQPASWYY